MFLCFADLSWVYVPFGLLRFQLLFNTHFAFCVVTNIDTDP